MTAPVVSPAVEQPDLVQLLLSPAEAEQLQSVLPWVVRALEDRPNLSHKQRERRRATRDAIDGLLTQLRAHAPADASDQAHVR